MLDCNNVEKITDITDQIDYEDTHSGGQGDSQWVSCGQDGDYNELQDKYDKHFKNVSGIPEKLIASIMCNCCKKLKPIGKEKVTWLKFYECMKDRLTLQNHPKTIKKLNELIEYHKS